jgi:hypothetical protein
MSDIYKTYKVKRGSLNFLDKKSARQAKRLHGYNCNRNRFQGITAKPNLKSNENHRLKFGSLQIKS